MLTFLLVLMLLGLGIALAVHFGYWDKWIEYGKKVLDGQVIKDTFEGHNKKDKSNDEDLASKIATKILKELNLNNKKDESEMEVEEEKEEEEVKKVVKRPNQVRNNRMRLEKEKIDKAKRSEKLKKMEQELRNRERKMQKRSSVETQQRDEVPSKVKKNEIKKNNSDDEVENFYGGPVYYTKEEFGDASNIDGMCNSSSFNNCGAW